MTRTISISRTVVWLSVLILIAPGGWADVFGLFGKAAGRDNDVRAPLEGLSSYPSDEPILVWDNDAGDKPDGVNGCEYFINLSLVKCGYEDITVTSQGENLTHYNLSNYSVVFALFGIAQGTGNISSEEVGELTTYLDNGGRLYLEGGDIGFHGADNAGSGEFTDLWPYLKANYVSNGKSFGEVNGSAHYLTDDMQFEYTGQSSSLDVVSPVQSSFSLFNNSSKGLGVAFNGSYRTIYLTFEYGGLVDSASPSTQLRLMKRFMHFFSFKFVRDIALVSGNLREQPNSFEGPTDDGWTHGGNQDSWQRGAPQAGPNAAYYGKKVWGTNLNGNYANNADCSLNLPTVVIGEDSELVFWHWYNFGRFFGDTGTVEIFDKDNNRWRALRTFIWQSGRWVKDTVSLKGFSGKVDIRFRLRTNQNNAFPGWYIDNVTLLSDGDPLSLREGGLYQHDDGYFVGYEREVEPNVTITNRGNMNASFDLRARVYHQSNDTVVYNRTVKVGLSEGETKNVGFTKTWNTRALKNETYIMEFRSLAQEVNGSAANDILSFWIHVGTYADLGVRSFSFNSTLPLLPDDVIEPSCVFANLGNTNMTDFTATLKITDTGSNVHYWKNVTGNAVYLPWNNTTTVAFPSWQIPKGDDEYFFNLSHNLTDNDNTNDEFRKWVRGEEYYDISIDSFYFNVSQPLNSTKVVTVLGNITNRGNVNVTNASIRCVVSNRSGGEFYNRTNATVNIDLPMGNRSEVPYANVTLPDEEGEITVVLNVLWPKDENSSNDRVSGEALIDDHHDVGVSLVDTVEMAGEQTFGYFRQGLHEVTTNVTNYGNVNKTPQLELEYMKADYLLEDAVEGESKWHNIELQGLQPEFHIVEPSSPYSDYHSPTHSWWFGDEKTGNYNDGLVNVLVRKIDLTNHSQALLRFWQNRVLVNDGFDFGCVVYNETMVNNPQQASYTILGDRYLGSSGGWMEENVDLSELTGQEILLGFAIVTDNWFGPTVDRGWYIDDITVTAPNRTNSETHVVACPEIAPGQNVYVTDNYDFKDNSAYYIRPKTLMDGDENGVNDMGRRLVFVRDFSDLALSEMAMSNARLTFLREDLEESDAGFYPEEAEDFEWGTPDFSEAPELPGTNNTNCWAIDLSDRYQNDLDIALNAPLDLKNFTGAILTYDSWFDIEEAADGLWLEIREADGDHVNITPEGGYPSTCNPPPAWGGGGPLPAFSGKSGGAGPGEDARWERIRFNLTEYVGNIAELRFRFLSDRAIIRPGWFLDNLKLTDPIVGAKYRLNADVNSEVDFSFENLGNIVTDDAKAELIVRGVTNKPYTYTDTISLDPLNPDASASDRFTTPWNTPDKEGIYIVSVVLKDETDWTPLNSNITIRVEVQDSHDIFPIGVMEPVGDQAYPLGENVDLKGITRNNGTHDETDILVNATIEDIGNESWGSVTFSTTIDHIKLKENNIASFPWTIPRRLGAAYRITYEISHPLDENRTDNVFSSVFYGLPERAESAVFGFVTDSTNASPFHGQPRNNVTVRLIDENNIVKTTESDEKGYYFLDLSDLGTEKRYRLEFHKDWYYTGAHEFELVPDRVYKVDMPLDVHNLKPRARLSVPLREPYYVLDSEVLKLDFSKTFDLDTPKQRLLYTLRSNISGLLYHGPEDSFSTSLTEGTHRLTLTVTDDMGGKSNHSVKIVSLNASGKVFRLDDELTVEVVGAGPGKLVLARNEMHNLPGGYLDLGYKYNIRTEGVFFALVSTFKLNYEDRRLVDNAREDNLTIFRYDHLYADPLWEVMKLYRHDREGNNISAILLGTNRSVDLDILLTAPEDREAPSVESTTPIDGSSEVSVSTPINITFSEKILFSQLSKDDISFEVGGTETNAFTLTYDNATATLSIVPHRYPLESKKVHRIKLYSVFDLVYNRMGEFEFDFRTEFWVPEKGKVSGFVKNQEGKTIEAAKVVIGGETVAATDIRGFYTFEIEEGVYEMVINGTGYENVFRSITVSKGRSVTESFIMVPFVFKREVFVEGYVRDDKKEPLEGVLVRSDDILVARTNETGFFSFRTAPGSYDIHITKEGYTSRKRTINTNGLSLSLEFFLRRMDFAVIKGMVRDEGGKGLEGVILELSKGMDLINETRTNETGAFYLEVPPGKYAIYFKKDGYMEVSRAGIDVDEGDIEDIEEDLTLMGKKGGGKGAGTSVWSWLILVIVIVLGIIAIALVAVRPAPTREEKVEFPVEEPPSDEVEDPELAKTDEEEIGEVRTEDLAESAEEVSGEDAGAAPPDTAAPNCPSCGRASEYYHEYDCYWCEDCQDYVFPVGEEERAPDTGAAPICSKCGQASEYYPEYDCYWCEDCQDYVFPEDEGERPTLGTGAAPACPTCGKASEYYPEYDSYWCEDCRDYVFPEDEGERPALGTGAAPSEAEGEYKALPPAREDVEDEEIAGEEEGAQVRDAQKEEETESAEESAEGEEGATEGAGESAEGVEGAVGDSGETAEGVEGVVERAGETAGEGEVVDEVSLDTEEAAEDAGEATGETEEGEEGAVEEAAGEATGETAEGEEGAVESAGSSQEAPGSAGEGEGEELDDMLDDLMGEI